jgi:hypothetical protein
MAGSLLASAKPTYYAFTFQNHDGSFFCDGMSLVLYTPDPGVTPKTLVDGIQTGCYAGYNTNGFSASVSPFYQFSAKGATMLLGTATNSPSSLIYQVNAVYHTWVNYESGGGSGEFVVNYGYWTNGVVAQQKGTKSSGQR